MKWAFAFIPALLFSPCAHAAEPFDPDACVSELAQYALGESMHLPCDSIDIAQKVIDGEEGVVPEKIYHYGPQKYLLEDAAAGTIPPKAWDQIVTNNTKYGPLRRGLYGTHGIDINRYNSWELVWELAGNWLMEIHIKPECREAQRVLSLKKIDEDPRFLHWLSQRPDPAIDLSYVKKHCHAGKWMDGITDESCAKLVESYMKEANIKVVVDFVNPKAFYIRDRDCIQDVRATRRQLLDSFITNPSLWLTSCSRSNELSFKIGDMFPYKLMRDVITGEKIDPPLTAEDLHQLQRNARLLPGSWGYRRPMIDGIDKLAVCYGKIPEDQCRKQARAKMSFWGL
jgi:hypothetical protein